MYWQLTIGATLFSLTAIYLYLVGTMLNDSLDNETVVGQKGYRVVVYFTNWGIYARNFNVWNMDWTKITHINYAFAKVLGDGTVQLTDSWADTDKRNTDHGDSWNDPNNNVFGNFGQLFKFKKIYRHVKVGLSIGGWTLSATFSDACATAASRTNFAKNVVQMIANLGLDFIDIDWEYPVKGGLDGNVHRPEDVANFILFLKELRALFSSSLTFTPEISMAVTANPGLYTLYDVKGLCSMLDHVNIMAYDFAGSWSTVSGHQANMNDYTGSDHLGIATAKAAADWVRLGCPSSKIVVGSPIYGRGFCQTKGLNQPFSACTDGTWEPGVYDYKKLPLPGATESTDLNAVGAYSYDPSKQQLISYENVASLTQKINLIKTQKYAGVMFWEISADYPSTDSRSLVSAAYQQLAPSGIDTVVNNLYYPTSKYPNIREYN